MKNLFKLLFMGFVTVLAVACGDNASKEEPYTGDYYGDYDVVVPVGTKSVLVSYETASGQTTTAEVPVDPQVVVPNDGKDVDPFGQVHLTLVSAVPTVANVTYQIYGKEVALLDNAVINTKVSAATKAGNTTVKLSEPKEYQTADLGYTFYHSSGVVMFEDSWPSSSRIDGKKYDSDFNDCIIDYDVEAVVVPDALLASEGWREQVKAVIHVRVTGAQAPWRVGMILEGFDQQYVESISDYKTLDSWQNPHGELPNWTVGTLQENSLHYESNPLRPCIEIGGLQRLNDANRGAGTEEYTRIDDKGTTHKTVFNPRVNKYWTSPKTEQYDAALADITTPATLAYIQSQTFYNAIPGYVNVDGGLYTYTVIYHMKPRAEVSPEESAKALKNMIDAVNVTTNQNFYIVNNDFSPVGLKGYQPVDFAVKEKPNGYKPRYDQVFAANTDKLDATIPYYSKGGQVWGFKSPTLTKHVWNKMYFSDAYPYYESWVDSNGSQNPDWNTKEVNNLYLTCWW